MWLQMLLYRLKRPYHFLKTGLWQGVRAELKYGFPARQLKVLAVTGTDGKTTSSTMLYEVLKAAGKKVALLSTVAAYIDDQQLETGLHVTTPDPTELHRLLRLMVNQGVEYVVLEVTSHGLYQYRTWGVHPYLAAITNLNHEHQDYHLNMDEYLKAKSLLFKEAQICVLNADDQSFNKLKRWLHLSAERVVSYSKEDRLPKVIRDAIEDRFVEPYNQMNARLVVAAATALDITPYEIAAGISRFSGVPGRMNELPNDRHLRIVVDFAHTPQAVKAVLQTLSDQRGRKPGKLIAVYGSAGLRDWQKRPAMGRNGAEIADTVIFTAEDPRTEDVWAIIHQMKQDLGEFHRKVISIADRRQAIEFALNQVAHPGDTVAFLGKGHEQSMCYGTTEYPWSDAEVIQETLSKKR